MENSLMDETILKYEEEVKEWEEEILEEDEELLFTRYLELRSEITRELLKRNWTFEMMQRQIEYDRNRTFLIEPLQFIEPGKEKKEEREERRVSLLVISDDEEEERDWGGEERDCTREEEEEEEEEEDTRRRLQHFLDFEANEVDGEEEEEEERECLERYDVYEDVFGDEREEDFNEEGEYDSDENFPVQSAQPSLSSQSLFGEEEFCSPHLQVKRKRLRKAIVWDEEEEGEENDNLMKLNEKKSEKGEKKKKLEVIDLTCDDETTAVPKTPLSETKRIKPTPLKAHHHLTQAYQTNKDSPSFSFSLSFPPDVFAKDSTKLFLRHRKEISRCLYKEYNQKVFQNRLPEDLPLNWSPRMRSTAGFFKYSIGRREKIPHNPKIELSMKVLDSYSRLRSTLCHEMCHAAVALVDKKLNVPPHGTEWQRWVREATQKYRNLRISSKHSYEISYKYIYECVKCHQQYKRHSKSITSEHACGMCRSLLVLVQSNNKRVEEKRREGSSFPSPPTPSLSAYTRFVKENYGRIAAENRGMTKSELMKLCADQYKEQKALSSS